jgi:dTDP-4-amino-4,6-dideoxygalactose transaminase
LYAGAVSDRPAILGGTPVRAGRQWPPWPQWDEGERSGLGAVLESGAWSSAGGEQANAFAAEFAAFQGAHYGLAVTNGTQTMDAALAACGIGEGDEVIVPAITFVATAAVVLGANATPVLVDVDPASLCIDVAAAEAAIGERTRAIIAVHIAGRPCDMDALSELCSRRGLVLIEDCAHAPGTRWRGRGAGSFGSFGSFSFEASKLITAGEGGALTANDEALRARAWSYVNCGRVEGGHWYHHASHGSNLRMTEWQGAVLRAQLRRYPEHHRLREERAALLDAELAKVPGLQPQSSDPRSDSRAYYSYVFHYEASEFAGMPLGGLEGALAAEGIEFGGSYPSLNTLELFRARNFGPRLRDSAPRIDYGSLGLPHAEHVAASTIWLSHRMLLAGAEEASDIAHALARIRAHAPAVARRTSAAGLRGRLGGAAERIRGALRARRA